MQENNFIVKNGKQLRFGYTTGSCATAAAAAATRMLFRQHPLEFMAITLPTGAQVVFNINDIAIQAQTVTCSVTKDAGDDPDVTDGIKIFATATLAPSEIRLNGGEGIGRITSQGLACPVGEAAINPVPRKMILDNVARICKEENSPAGVTITIFVPAGEQLATKTFNPRLGIVGGISILGTTGIVEPMSEKAIVDTIKLLIDKQSLVDSENILITPGNYGRDYCREVLQLDIEKAVKCSNFIGETIDYLVYRKFQKVLLVGHIGKLVKIAGGIMNTHSAIADCRNEIFAAHTALAGADKELVQKVMNSLTTDQILEHLDQADICEQVFASILERILFQLNYRSKNALQISVIAFSNKQKKIFKSKNTTSILELLQTNHSH